MWPIVWSLAILGQFITHLFFNPKPIQIESPTKEEQPLRATILNLIDLFPALFLG
jgi:hypothetical protein